VPRPERFRRVDLVSLSDAVFPSPFAWHLLAANCLAGRADADEFSTG
jgi:hypothetical protein